jgi:hypothetical protein
MEEVNRLRGLALLIERCANAGRSDLGRSDRILVSVTAASLKDGTRNAAFSDLTPLTTVGTNPLRGRAEADVTGVAPETASALLVPPMLVSVGALAAVRHRRRQTVQLKCRLGPGRRAAPPAWSAAPWRSCASSARPRSARPAPRGRRACGEGCGRPPLPVLNWDRRWRAAPDARHGSADRGDRLTRAVRQLGNRPSCSPARPSGTGAVRGESVPSRVRERRQPGRFFPSAGSPPGRDGVLNACPVTVRIGASRCPSSCSPRRRTVRPTRRPARGTSRASAAGRPGRRPIPRR